MRQCETFERHIRCSPGQNLIGCWQDPDVSDVDKVVVMPCPSSGEVTGPIVLEVLAPFSHHSWVKRKIIRLRKHDLGLAMNFVLQ
jgi:hypothetical protein